MKKKTSSLKLFMKPDEQKPLSDLKYAWITDEETSKYLKVGFKRIKDLKGGIDYVSENS